MTKGTIKVLAVLLGHRGAQLGNRWPIELYSSVTWTYNRNEKESIRAFEFWCFQCMQKIYWVDRVTNGRVLQQVNEQRTIIYNIKSRKLQCLGRTLKHDGPLQGIISWNKEEENL